ncbi:hypothetical protein [Chitinophaga lutea]|nr:hypothetical protein [Chitinophaga lutea]
MEKKPDQINLPGVEDIPGQENVKPAPLGELADTTASSDDEEGKGALDNEEETLIAGDSNVTAEERELLDEAANSDPAYRDDQNLRNSSLENRDEDGELLNEADDLDVPGAELDDEGEDIGAEDEENNPYSLGDNE